MGEAFNWGAMRKDATTFLEGEFPFVIESVAVKSTAKAGKVMFAMQVVVESGQFAGRTMKHNITVSPESPVAMRIFFQDMETLGLTAQFFDNPQLQTEQGPEIIAQALTSKRFTGVCKPRDWNDRPQDNIESIKPAGRRPTGPGVPTRPVVTSSTPSASVPSATPTPSVPTPSASATPTPSATPKASVPPPPTAPGDMEPAF